MLNIKKASKHIFSIQFLKFMIVGASGTILDYMIFVILKNFNWYTIAANTVSYSVGLINNYYWNSKWTFRKTGKCITLEEFVQFTIISLTGLAINTSIVTIMEPVFDSILGQKTLTFIMVKVIATGLVLFWNYFANKKWTFNSIQKKHLHEEI